MADFRSLSSGLDPVTTEDTRAWQAMQSQPYTPGRWGRQFAADAQREYLPSVGDTEDQAAYRMAKIFSMMMPGGRAAPGTLGGSAIKGPWPSGMEKQIQEQLPRLERLFKELVLPKGVLPELKPEPGSATRIFSTEVRPRFTHFLGGDYVKYGGDTNILGRRVYNPPAEGVEQKFNYHYDPAPYKGAGVGPDFATPEEAKRAIIRYEIRRQRGSGYEDWMKPIPPEISEFASPESARGSWKVIK